MGEVTRFGDRVVRVDTGVAVVTMTEAGARALGLEPRAGGPAVTAAGRPGPPKPRATLPRPRPSQPSAPTDLNNLDNTPEKEIDHGDDEIDE
jgi:hypothetical protein